MCPRNNFELYLSLEYLNRVCCLIFQIQRIDLTESLQYFLEVESDMAKKHPNLQNTIVAGNESGETSVILRDTNVGKDDQVKAPSAELHIVVPSYIVIEIAEPNANWNVILGQTYKLYITVFDSNNRKLFPSANMVAEIDINTEYFLIDEETKNGTWLTGKPINIGSALVEATLLGVEDVETGTVPTF